MNRHKTRITRLVRHTNWQTRPYFLPQNLANSFFVLASWRVALFLACALTLPNPTFALRPLNVGLEENSQVNRELETALRRSATSGLEESVVLLYPTNAKETNELQRRMVELDSAFGVWEPNYARKKIAQLLEDLEKIIAIHSKSGKGLKKSGRFQLGELLMHYPIFMRILLELLIRLDKNPTEFLKELKSTKPRSKIAVSYALVSYHQGRMTLGQMRVWELKGIGDLFESGGSMEESYRALLKGLSEERSADRQNFMKQLQELDEKIASWTQWDFLHRFPGASGMRLMRGAEKHEFYKVGKIISLKDAYFTHVPTYALQFPPFASEGVQLVAADVPLESIRRTSWTIFPGEKPYEAEILVTGPAVIQDLFQRDRMEDFFRWVDLDRRYQRVLQSLPSLDPRDLKSLESSAKNPQWWFFKLMHQEFQEETGGIVGQDVDETFQRAIERAVHESQGDYKRAAQWLRSLIEIAIDQTPDRISRFIESYVFLGEPSSPPSVHRWPGGGRSNSLGIRQRYLPGSR